MIKRSCRCILKKLKTVILKMECTTLLNSFMFKTIAKILQVTPMAEGVGATVRRSIGSRHLRNLDPFLLLDYMETSDQNASFPDHPHRGIETVTHVYQGTIEHEDFTGSEGKLYPGDLQVMTAGKGIMHAEIPRPPPEGGAPSLGLQLWVDLPKRLKNIDPLYKDIRNDTVPSTEPYPGVFLRTISNGAAHSITRTPIYYWDYSVSPTKTPVSITSPLIPTGWTSFLYVSQGSLQVVSGSSDCQQTALEHSLVVYDRNESAQSAIQVIAPIARNQARFTICAGLPLNQEIFRDMFFVQNSKEQLRQSKTDFKEKINGFENAKGWKSKIAGNTDFKLHI